MDNKKELLKFLKIQKEYWEQEEKDTKLGSCSEPYEHYDHGVASGKADILGEIVKAIEDGNFEGE